MNFSTEKFEFYGSSGKPFYISVISFQRSFFFNFKALSFCILFKWCLLLIKSAVFGEDAIFYSNGDFAGF